MDGILAARVYQADLRLDGATIIEDGTGAASRSPVESDPVLEVIAAYRKRGCLPSRADGQVPISIILAKFDLEDRRGLRRLLLGMSLSGEPFR